MLSNKPKVFAIVLNYNGKDCLVQCLDSLYACSYPELEIVIVDNASTDESIEMAKNKFSRFHFIKNSSNLGFATGNNVAIRFALEKMADYVFLLNNDATIEKDAIEKLVEQGELEKNIGILSPVIMDSSKVHVWFSGGKISWKKMRAFHSECVPLEKPYETEYASGCAVLIKKEVFKEIGLFDEKFFLYYEDADFSLRANRAGFKSFIVPGSIAYHLEKSQKENPNKLYWLVLSGIIFFKKNARGFAKLWINFYFFIRKIKAKFKRGSDAVQVKKAFSDYKEFSKN